MDSPGNALLRARTTLATAARSVRRALDADERRASRVARRGLRLPPLPQARRRDEVWAISMVRNEIDVLPMVLDHLVQQGVDRILVADNGSTDGTLELLEERAATGELLLANDSEPAFYQAAKMTRLALAARQAGAQWVVPFDADELWFAAEGLLAQGMRRQHADVLGARVLNAFPTGGDGWVVDLASGLNKVAFRAHRLAVIGAGNHRVDRPGPRLSGADSPLRVVHLPWRSFDQFARKVRQGARAVALTTGLSGSDHWRALGGLDDETLRRRWEAIVAGRAEEGVGWTPRGPFVPADPTSWRTWDPDGVLRGV